MNKIEDSKIPWGKNVEETILGIVSEFNYPVLFNFPAGHISDNRAFLYRQTSEIKIKSDRAILYMSDNQKADIRRSRSLDIIPNFWPSVSFVSIPLYK